MNTATVTTSTSPTDPGSDPRVLSRLTGLALIAAPLLTFGGHLTSPPQPDSSAAGYIASLAADPGMSALSAGLYHYGWVAVAFGVLSATGLVPGVRGRALTAVAAVVAAFGAIQMSGLLLSDHYLAALGPLPSDTAVAVFGAVSGSAWVSMWMLSGQVFALLGVPLVLAGLARAGVIGWWAGPVYLTAWIVPGLVPAPLGALLGLAAATPLVLVGLHLVQRSTATARSDLISA